jgi:hypothetical protein
MSLIEKDVADYLDSSGFGTIGTNIFFGEWGKDAQDQDIDKQLLVISTSGNNSDQPDLYEEPGFQVLSRGSIAGNATEAGNIATQVWQALIQAGEVTINSVIYQCFEPRSSLMGLGRDENQRHVYSMNFWTVRNPY